MDFANKVQDYYSEMSGGADEDDPFERLLLLQTCMVAVAEALRVAMQPAA